MAETPLFQKYDSFYRLLAKACAPDPADRFQTADELRVQLIGVLREIVATRTSDGGRARHSAPSVLFEAPVVESDVLDWKHLPALKVDSGDPMAAWLSALSVTEPGDRLNALYGAPEETVEVRLEMARTAIAAGRPEVADGVLTKVLQDDPWEWRAVWVSGLSSLATDDEAGARASFNAVYGQVPGRARRQARAGVRVRAVRRGRRRRGAVHGLRPDRRQLHSPGRVRPGPDPARPRGPRRRPRRARPGAGDEPGVRRGAQPAGRPARASGRGLASLSDALGSIETVTIDPLQRARLVTGVLDAALTVVTDRARRRR